jgi:death-on-curing protein
LVTDSDDFEYLESEDLLALAVALLGDPPPLRDAGLLASAAARPRMTLFGDDAYPDVWTKAAALLQSIVKGHPLVDGNKRLGWLATAVFLDLNGISVTDVKNDAVYRFVIHVAATNHDIATLATMLVALVEPARQT